LADPQFLRLFGVPQALIRETSMTGQVLFRRSSQPIQVPKGGYETAKVIYMLYGVVAIPKSSIIKDHVTYPLIGYFNQEQLINIIAINEGEDHNKLLIGEGASGVFRAPIWRV